MKNRRLHQPALHFNWDLAENEAVQFSSIVSFHTSPCLHQNSLWKRSICFIFPYFGSIRTKQQLISLHEKSQCVRSSSKFNLSLCKKKKKKGCGGRECASNYLKCKINKSQTCVTFSPIIINKGRIWRERLVGKHSPLLLAGQIKLSLERLPVVPHAYGKNKDHSQLRVPCDIQLRVHRRPAY